MRRIWDEIAGKQDGIDDLVNGVVITVSQYYIVGKEPIGTCSRYDKKKQKCTKQTRPVSIERYHQHTGGSDKADVMLSLYKTK